MSTFIFFGACIIIALIVLSKIPGLEHFVKPLVGLFFKLVEASITTLWAYTVYLLKTLLSSHIDLCRHLILPAEKIDPAEAIRKEM